jgi:hypothetical protein
MLVIALLTGALVVGLAARRLVRDPVDREGLPVAQLAIPLRLLSTLLLAFVLAQAYTSFKAAGDAASREASAVLSEAEVALLIGGAPSMHLAQSLGCYAQAAVGEWHDLQHGGHGSPLAARASARVQLALGATAEATGEGLGLSSLLAAEGQRAQARGERVGRARSSVPGIVMALLLACTVVVIAVQGLFGHHQVRTAMKLTLLIATTGLFGATLLVIEDLQQPYGGAAKVGPTAMQATASGIAGLLPGGRLDCPA